MNKKQPTEKQPTEPQKQQLAALDSMIDEQVDTSDIPEVKSFAEGVRAVLRRDASTPRR